MSSEELSPDELSALLTSYMPDIPGYRVLRRIGKGGMSYVYLGVQESLDRQVAIKVMSPEALTDEKSKQRFEQEARTIAKLEHPCIVGIHEVGRTPQGLLYYVLPYLAKGHLGQRDFSGDEQRTIEVLRSLLSALEYAHARGIVHRDVKAENVLFDNADRPLLTDFGIALSRRDHARITTAGLAVGSGGYMAPEQARGEAVDGRADLYSVGVLAYELLSGRLPYLANDPLALALMHAQDPIPRLPPERRHWQPFLDRAMAKSPENRFRNAQQMLAALNQLANKERPAASENAPVGLSLAAIPRHWLKPALFSLTGLVLLILVILIMRPETAPAPEPVDFFTSQDALASKPAPAAPVAAASTGNPAPPTPAAAPAASTAPSNSAAAFANVQASVAVTQLDYDPTLAGAREISAARAQIKQNRLSTPAGGNAIESLLAAYKIAPGNAEVDKLSEAVISGLETALAGAIRTGHDDTAKSTYQRAQKFAQQNQRLEGAAWKTLRASLPPLLVTRLEKSGKGNDSAGIDKAKALAQAMDVDSASLEPAWSKASVQPKTGEAIHGKGPAVVLVQPANDNTPGIAFMRTEVTHDDFADFANSTQRPSARCRNRLAPITIKKRTWAEPGFAQPGSHPVVCVSYSDAQAYAQWLSHRTGETYRLPTAAEWRKIASYRGSGDPCQDGRLHCGQEGTAPAGQGPLSPLGINGVHGNVREWLTDCDGGCQRRLTAGLGWRDGAERADPVRTSGFDASVGFDDVGFRLVREIDNRP